MMTSIEVLAKAIGYPDEIPENCRDCILSVDDFEVRAQETNGRLRLSTTVYTPPRDGSDVGTLAQLATYVPGRILKEEAALAWDPDSDSAILWQEFPATADANDLRRFFEVYTASFEWWRERVRTAHEPEPAFPEMVIIP